MAAQSTYDALLWTLREYGLSRLSDSRTLERLSELTSTQLEELVAALTRLQTKYPRTCTDELIQKLRDQQ
jgi:hypothetical protein